MGACNGATYDSGNSDERTVQQSLSHLDLRAPIRYNATILFVKVLKFKLKVELYW